MTPTCATSTFCSTPPHAAHAAHAMAWAYPLEPPSNGWVSLHALHRLQMDCRDLANCEKLRASGARPEVSTSRSPMTTGSRGSHEMSRVTTLACCKEATQQTPRWPPRGTCAACSYDSYDSWETCGGIMRDGGKVQDSSATKWRTSEPLRMTPCSAASCPGSTEHRDFHDGAETTATAQATNLEGKAEASLASREPGLMRQMRLGVFYGLLWSSMVFYGLLCFWSSATSELLSLA